VKLCGTTVIGSKENAHFKSILLSESSLIVYPKKIIIKTCGRTVPLASIPKALSLGRSVGLAPEWLCYTRKNFLAPLKQPAEHQRMEAEMANCRRTIGLGDGYVLGPLTGEHWLCYNADFLLPDCNERGDYTVDIMMYGLPADVRQNFSTDEPEGSRKGAVAMTRGSGLGAVIDTVGGDVDDYCFAPGGYSCNVHAGEAYMITHVTPEEDCSYASFETNFGCDMKDKMSGNVEKPLNDLIRGVLDVFRPAKFTMTLWIDAGAVEAIGTAPFSATSHAYRRTSKNSYHFESDYIALVANYVRGSISSAEEIQEHVHSRM
jgi:S-adenosylmethionine decarboxylase